MLADTGYVEWLRSQPGVMEMLQRRSPTVFNILMVGAPKLDDSPEHNALEAKFLEESFQYAFIELATGKSVYSVSAGLSAIVNRELDAALNKYKHGTILDWAARDCVEAKKHLEQAREKYAGWAREDSHAHYQKEYKDYLRQKRENEGRVKVGQLPIGPGRFPSSHEEWLKEYRYGSWPTELQNLERKIVEAEKLLKAYEESYQKISANPPQHVIPNRPGVRVEFECGYDIELLATWSAEREFWKPPWEWDDYQFSEFLAERYTLIQQWREKRFCIELKPQMGDDFPAVLRQMKRNGADILVIGSFEATTCNLEQVRKMFGEKKIITLQEIESIRQKGPTWP